VSSSEPRLRSFLPLTFLFGGFVYLYGLGGFYIPHIGDEAPYIEITRLTAESSHWLPLVTAPGLENTKPPLLFWLGMVATEWGEKWSLLRLRLPIVFATFATALVVFWLIRRLGWEKETALLGAVIFLGFYSSFHYGRPFLTNSPETLFVFTSFALVLGYSHRARGWLLWLAAGLVLGLACLVKSFALVVPLGLALSWLSAAERGFDLRETLRSGLPRVGLTVGVAVLCFGLWPLFDPEPGAIFRHFVLEENLGKLEGEGYLSSLLRGPYALHWLWLGHFANAGLYAVPLLFLVVRTVRDRKSLSRVETSLWILVLAFLLVYSLPRQRQVNYLIPTVPALSILLALRFEGFPASWFRWFAIPGVVFSAGLLRVVLAVRDRALPPGSYSGLALLALAVMPLLWLAIVVRPRSGRDWFPGLVFGSFFLITVATGPFEGPLGRFAPDRLSLLEGKRVFVPAGFVSRQERHRFLLPGARVEGYDPADADNVSRLLESGAFVVLHRPLGNDPEGPYRIIARRFDLRSRQTLEEMFRILWNRDMNLLVRQEIVVRRHRLDRMIGERER
jgi:4-amino-4-deoxy-L-arabinose transferase-like glycosyltransferase